MKELKRDLKSLQKSLNALSDKVDKIVEGLEKLEKAPVTRKKPAVAKKKGRASRKQSEKKEGKRSATQMVLEIIQGNGKGVDTATLKQKTGFDQRKIWGIINNLKKQGKVKSGEKGVYVKA
jgi:hypothetical protein